MIVLFVDIGEIVDHQCVNFLFIIVILIIGRGTVCRLGVIVMTNQLLSITYFHVMKCNSCNQPFFILHNYKNVL